MLYCYEGFCSENVELVKEHIAEHAYYIGEEGLLNIIENDMEIYDSENGELGLDLDNFSEYVKKVEELEQKYTKKFNEKMMELGYEILDENTNVYTYKGNGYFKIEIDFSGVIVFYNNAVISAADFVILKDKIVLSDVDGNPVIALERIK